MLVELVNHVWNPPGMVQYGEMIRWQWAALKQKGRRVRIRYTLFCAPQHDEATRRSLEIIERHPIKRVELNVIPLPRKYLFSRCIGRNFAASVTDARVVWYQDVDYVVGDGTLDTLHDTVEPGIGLCKPRHWLIHIDHATGDRDMERGYDVELPEINPRHFKQERCKICIGGVQILDGDTAREMGYMGASKFCRPADPARGFVSFMDDVRFRKRYGDDLIKTIDIPNIYRMRHSVNGYEVEG